MATGTTVSMKDGRKAFFPSEIIPFLEQAKQSYRIDAAGMADGGMCLTSTFVSYCDIEKMAEAIRTNGQPYKVLEDCGQDHERAALIYATRYDRLFEISE